MKDKKNLLTQMLEKVKAKKKDKVEHGVEKEAITEYSRFVEKFKDEDNLVVLGQAVNKKAKYCIELEIDEFEKIMRTYPYRDFECFYANMEETYDFDNEKVFVNVTFREISEIDRIFIGETAIPGFRLNLLRYGDDEALADKVFRQLNKQALEMEANTKEEDKWNIPELSMD